MALTVDFECEVPRRPPWEPALRPAVEIARRLSGLPKYDEARIVPNGQTLRNPLLQLFY
jgi:hypothetical protein